MSNYLNIIEAKIKQFENTTIYHKHDQIMVEKKNLQITLSFEIHIWHFKLFYHVCVYIYKALHEYSTE